MKNHIVMLLQGKKQAHLEMQHGTLLDLLSIKDDLEKYW